MAYLLFFLAFLALGAGMWLLLSADTRASHTQPRRSWPNVVFLRRGQNTARRVWAETNGFRFAKTDSTLVGQWQRGAASTGAAPRDIATGQAHHHDVCVMELGGVTVIAMTTGEESDVVVDMRRDGFEDATKPSSKQGLLPADDLVEVERAAGFTIWGTDPGPVQRFVDVRVHRALAQLPEAVDAVWFEDEWVLAQLPRGAEPEQWEATFEPLAHLADSARTLPPCDAEPLTLIFGLDTEPGEDANTLPEPEPEPEAEAEAEPEPGAETAPEPAEEPAGKEASISKKASQPRPSAAETKLIAKVQRPEAPLPLPTRTTGTVRGPVQQRPVGGDQVEPIADPLADASGPAHGPARAPHAANDLTKVRRQFTPPKIFSTSATGEKENQSE